MAQVQAARYAMNGPSWDEEVVPALRKRLQNESRTLAKRMSAVSLASQNDHFISMYPNPTPAVTYTNTKDTPYSPFLQSNASARRNQYQSVTRDRIPTSARLNGITPSKRKLSSPTPGSASEFQRSRTYSQPYISDTSYGTYPRPKTKGSSHNNGKSSLRPTRIPQPTGRSPPLSASTTVANQDRVETSPTLNGHHQHASTPTTPVSHSAFTENGQRTPTALNRPSLSVNVNTNVGLGLLDEVPPFNPASASSSKTPSQRSASPDTAPPRPSTESEERPFEHWYRGEVSRNGGVGELRVGRRQEMLDIANYGHTIRARERERRENRARRKRADSVSVIGDDRESLHLDEDVTQVGRVLDEAPLTDMDGSEGGHYDDDEVYGYGARHEDEGDYTWRQEDSIFDEGQDDSIFDEDLSRTTINGTTSPQQETSRTSHETGNTTPTPTTFQPKQPDSRNAAARPSRIPARSRQTSESRVVTPTPIIRGASEPPPTPSSSHTPPHQSRERSQRQPKATPNKRAASKPRTPAVKTRAKTVASAKDLDEEARRRSVARYPTPGDDGDETMIDAIPEWTQPVPHQGNWDDVVLPVVARKKGLDEHYQKADGNTPPRIVSTTPAPAPGTFGYDGSKYRRPRADVEPDSIPMDEFGQTKSPIYEPQQPPEEEKPPAPSAYDRHDRTRLPARAVLSPTPFSEYAPGPSTIEVGPPVHTATTTDMEKRRTAVHQLPEDQDDEGGGCCKCVIM